MTNPFTQPDYSAQSGDAYKALIDAAIEIVNKTAGSFNPHAQTVPDMTLRLDAGSVYNPITRARSDVAAQSTGTITAPSANPRKDIVCVGILTGTVSVITGAEAGSPTDPAITADLIPIARITLQTSTTTITDAITDDIRELGNLGLEASAIGLKNIANTWTKTQTWTKGTDEASATNITPGDGNYFDITGTTTIATIASKGIGTTIKLHFDGILTLTHSTDLFLPGAADITTAAGDEAEFVEYASADWRCTSYQVAASAPGAGGATTFIASTDLSNDATVAFTGFDAGSYDGYLFTLQNVVPATDAANLLCRTSTDGGSNYDAGASNYIGVSQQINSAAGGGGVAAESNTGARVFQETGSDAGEDGVSGNVWIWGPHLAKDTMIIVRTCGWTSDGNHTDYRASHRRDSSADVDAVQFLASSGNLESGTINMYGYKNS